MTTRTKALISAFLSGSVLLALQFLNFEIKYINIHILKSSIVAIIYFISINWVLDYKIKGIRFITIAGYSTFLVFIFSLFLELGVFQNIERISQKTISFLILLIFSIGVYFLNLTINILNISYVSRIPLAQAAKATNFIYTLFGGYFSFLVVLRIGGNQLIKIPILTLIVFILTLNIFWFKKESNKQLLGETVTLTVFMLSMFVFMSFWPVKAEVLSMFYILIFYILLNLGLEERETATWLMYLEYLVLIFFFIIYLLKTTVWGINGTFI